MIVEIERVLPLMAAILIFSRTESNLGKSIKSTSGAGDGLGGGEKNARPLGTTENQDGRH